MIHLAQGCLRPGPSGRVAGVATAEDFFTLFLRDASEFTELYHNSLGDRCVAVNAARVYRGRQGEREGRREQVNVDVMSFTR